MGAMVISFVGKTEYDDKTRTYQKLRYRFQTKEDTIELEGSFFGKVLLDYLNVNKKKVTRVVILGTRQSSWYVISELLPPEKRTKLLNFKNALQEPTPEILQYFSEEINKHVPYKISLEMVTNEQNLKELQREIARNIYKHLNQEIQEAYLDITHGLRFMPFIALGILLPARYVSLKKISVYYGYSESTESVKPAIELTGLEEMIELDEAMATFEFTGNFYKPASTIYKKAKDKFRKAFYLFEINNSDTTLLKELARYPESYFYSPIAAELKRLSKSEDLEEIFIEKAKFYFSKSQYFKAIPLLFEAIVTLIAGKLYGEEAKNNHQQKEKAKNKVVKFLDHTEKTNYKKLKLIRNRIVHGGKSKDDSKVIEYIQNEEELKRLFQDCVSIYEKLREITLEHHEKNEEQKYSLRIIDQEDLEIESIF